MRLGLVLNMLDEEYQISVYSGVKKRTQELGIDLVCFQQENTRLSTTSFMAKLNRTNLFNLDGILLLTPVLIDGYEFNTVRDVKKIWGDCPVVSIGQKITDVPSIIVQTDDSMKQLVEHLILHHNYRNFVYISGSKKHKDTIQREKIFEQTIEAYKPWFSDLKYTKKEGWFSETAAMEAMDSYFKENPEERPDVIVCASDNMAIGVYKFFKMSDKFQNQMPCAVTGFDDIPQAKFELPPLTTIHQPLSEMASKSVDVLVDLIKKRKPKDDLYVESKLVLRNSCGCVQNYEGNLKETRTLMEQLQEDYVKSERMLKMVTRVGQTLNYAENMEGLKYGISADMDQLGINNFCILSFSKATLESLESQGDSFFVTPVYVRRNGKIFYEFAGNRELSLSEFYDKYLAYDNDRPPALVFKFLYSGVKIVGCVLYDAKEEHLSYLTLISVNVAQSINRIETAQEKQEYSEYLEKEVNKRTQELVEANNKRMEVEAEVLKISEIERQRFSTDLHDDICQRLAGISMLCRSYYTSGKEIDKSQMVELAELISDTLQRTRQYAHNSYPVELESLGLNHSLNNLCNSFTQQMGLECNYEWALPPDLELDKIQKLNIFRIIQEALHNVGKHAKASKVDVVLKIRKKAVVIQVIDDGCGVPKQIIKNAKTGLGLNSMQYRANQIDATFTIKSNKPSGTIVEVVLK